ncbi:MAG: translation initiation factor IF-3 [Pseudoxanthomonas sp.]|nr:translation initiation factor IF-3 [Pseudoxanthomonas sp.]
MSTPDNKQNRKNHEIRVPRVRVIGSDGEMIGVLSRDEALAKAEDEGLDLVEIQPNAEPPVCKIMDFGKFKFEMQKKANEAKKKQKQVEIKELKFRPVTDEGDYQIKMRNIRRFLEEGDKVKVNIRFRGREMSHQELGREMAARIEAELGDEIVIESRPRLEGRQMVMMIAPKRSDVGGGAADATRSPRPACGGEGKG